MESSLFCHKFEKSVEDAIAKPISNAFGSDLHKFHTGGREDIDVRMLGSGRPFVVELLSPRFSISCGKQTLKILEVLINKEEINVGVSGLEFTDNSCFAVLTEAASAKVKVYAAIIQTENELKEEIIEKINLIRDLEIDQMTPLRVLHRRTLMTRDKIIYRCFLDKINRYSAVCYILSSAGTYIKEFVHGDLNRTKPNLGTLLGCKCDIIQLDVLDLYSDFSVETVAKYDQLVQKMMNVSNLV